MALNIKNAEMESLAAAALNFGDRLSYATASVAQQPLLFVGNNSKSDIPPA